MEDKGQITLHSAQSREEMEEKIRQHKMRRLKLFAIIAGACAAIVIIYYVAVQHKAYKEYHIIEQIERSDTAATHYLQFQGELVKYSNDGASYVDFRDELIWNQGYEMESPIAMSCGDYLAIADKRGDQIFLMDPDGLVAEIKVNMPIQRVSVASQGNLAVLMTENGTGYVALFDKSGNQIVEGAIHAENGGTPMDIALSADGSKLAVSILDISGGKAGTILNFYNFTAVGQNQIDNIVTTDTYEDTVIPSIAYLDNNTMLAFGDTGVFVYTGTSTPSLGYSLECTEEIQSVFYNKRHFGLVYSDPEQENGRKIHIYDVKCREEVAFRTAMAYDAITFMENDEICMMTDRQCAIYTMGGREKFIAEFDEPLCGIFSGMGYRNYIFLMQNATDRVRLKLLDGKEEVIEGTIPEDEMTDVSANENKAEGE